MCLLLKIVLLKIVLSNKHLDGQELDKLCLWGIMHKKWLKWLKLYKIPYKYK